MTAPERALQSNWFEFAKKKVTSLCRAFPVSARQEAETLETIARLMHPWGAQRIETAPSWPSDISDDHTPFEVSVAMEPDRVDLRILLEAQGPDMEKDLGWRHAFALTETLGKQHHVSLDRFRAIAPLFTPDRRVPARFGLWHAAVVPYRGPVLYKLYVNPRVLGPCNAPGLVREAIEVLGIDSGWEAIQKLMAIDAVHNEPVYLALDLADTARARVKVYVAHHGVHASSLDQQLSLFANYNTGHATQLIQQLADHDGPFHERPVLTCLGFRGSQAEPEVTIHFPVRCYAAHDEAIAKRLERILGPVEGGTLKRAVQAYGGRPLQEGRGLITYISLSPSRLGRAPRTVAYLSPEAYAVSPPLDAVSSPLDEGTAPTEVKTGLRRKLAEQGDEGASTKKQASQAAG